MNLPEFLFHGTAGDGEIVEAINEQGLLAVVGAGTKSDRGLIHDVDFPVVWLTDKIGMAGHFAINSPDRINIGGTIFVIDTKLLDQSKFVYEDGNYIYPYNHDGDEDGAVHYAYKGNIPADAIIDECYTEDYTEAIEFLKDDYGGNPNNDTQ